jgi:peroxiredoxin
MRSRKTQMVRARKGHLVGRPGIPFELQDTDGRTHRLSDYRGCWLLLVFHRHLG